MQQTQLDTSKAITVSWHQCLQFSFLFLGGILGSLSLQASADAPEDCGADMADFVLPCFVAYKADLQPIHHREIDEIVRSIEVQLSEGYRIDIVAVVGYGVFFRPDDPAVENSRKRVNNVRAALLTALRDRGIRIRSGQVVAVGLGDPTPQFQATTQRDRWFLRRVKVFVSYADKRRRQEGECEPDLEMVARLENFDKNYSDPGKEYSVRCLATLLRRHYSCEERNTSSYLHLNNLLFWTSYVERFERGQKPFGGHSCAAKEGNELKWCMGTLDKDIIAGMKPLVREIALYGIEAQASDIPRMPECRLGRRILDQFETNRNSPYSCYPVQSEGFGVCGD